MAGLKKQAPTDAWSVRERLCLASSVLRSGDQNWNSVSRAIKPFGEPNRPQDWFSPKNCALQYSDLLERVETPKRKRREGGDIETPGESIVRKLTLERVEDLRRLIVQQQQKHKKVKEELILVQSGQADDRLHRIWAEIQEEKRKQQQDAENHQKWLQEREAANLAACAALRAAKVAVVPKKVASKRIAGRLHGPESTTAATTDSDACVDSSQDDSPHVDSFGEESSSQDCAALAAATSFSAAITTSGPSVATSGHPAAAASSSSNNSSMSAASSIAGSTMLSPTISTTHHSPLLNTLLRSSSSSHAAQTTTSTPLSTSKDVSPRSQASTSPTISSLLAAPNMSAGSFNTSVANLLTSALSGTLEHHHHHHHHHHDMGSHIPTARPPITSPSQGAPTLLKLLDMPLGVTGKLPPLPIVNSEEDMRPLLPPPLPLVIAATSSTSTLPTTSSTTTTSSSVSTMITSSPVIQADGGSATLRSGDVLTGSADLVDAAAAAAAAATAAELEVVTSLGAALADELPSFIEFVTEEELDIVGESTVETTPDESSDLLLDVGDVEEVVIGGSGNTSSLDLALDVVGLSEEVVFEAMDDESQLDVLLASTEKDSSVEVIEVFSAPVKPEVTDSASLESSEVTAIGEGAAGVKGERSAGAEAVKAMDAPVAAPVDHQAALSEPDTKPVMATNEIVPLASYTKATNEPDATNKPEVTKSEKASAVKSESCEPTVSQLPDRPIKSEATEQAVVSHPAPTTPPTSPPVRPTVTAEPSDSVVVAVSQPTPVSSKAEATKAETTKVEVSKVEASKVETNKAEASTSSDNDSDAADSVQSSGGGGGGEYGTGRGGTDHSSSRGRTRRTRGRRGGRWTSSGRSTHATSSEEVTLESSTEGVMAEEPKRVGSRRISQDSASCHSETTRRPTREANRSGMANTTPSAWESTRSTRSRRDEREEVVSEREPDSERVGRLRGDSRRGTPRGQQAPTQKPAAASAAATVVPEPSSSSRDVDDLLEALRGDLEDDKQRLLGAESLPNSPASTSFSGDDPESVKDYKVWKKAIMLVWRSAANHKNANVFLHPVTEEMAPGYHSIVHRPMDLMTVKRHVETGVTRTTAEFQRDIMLMFQNAIMYNNSDHDVCHMAVEMQREVCNHIQDFVATQLIVQSAAVGAPKPPPRRETRGEHAHKKGGESSTSSTAVSTSTTTTTTTTTTSSEKGAMATPEPDNTKRKRLISDSESSGGKSKRRRTRADD